MKTILFIWCAIGCVTIACGERFEDCKSQTKIPEDELASFKKGGQLISAEGNCFLACMLKAEGVMKSDGQLNKEEIMKSVKKNKKDEERTQKFFDKCGEMVAKVDDKGEGCERAGVIFKCTLELEAEEKKLEKS